MSNVFLQVINSFSRALESQYGSISNMAPYILGALIVFIYGLILAELVYRGLIAMSKKLKLEYIAEKVGLEHYLKRTKAKITSSHVIAKTVKGYLIFVFFVEATKIAHLTQVADFLTSIISYVPNVIIAIFIMLIGMRVGNTMNSLIRTSLSFAQSNTANVLGIAAKYVIFIFAVLAALSELAIAEILIQSLFIGFVAMLTLAGGLAFGLGGKDIVKELLEAIKKVEIKEYKKSVKEAIEEERAIETK